MSPRNASLKPKKLSNGSWQVSVPPGVSESGRRERRTFPTEDEALRFVERVQVSVDWLARVPEPRLLLLARRDCELRDLYGKGLLEIGLDWELEQQQLDASGATLGELMTLYKRDFEPRWKSKKNKFYQLENHLAEIGGERLHRMNTAFWSKWLSDAAKQRHWGASSFNGYASVLSSMFQHAVSLDLVESNPIERVAKRRASQLSQAVVWEVEECRRILNVAWEHEKEMVPWLACALFLGLRPDSELMALRWEDFDWERKRVEVVATKTEKRRWPDIRPNLEAWVEPFRKESGSILPLSKKTREPLTTLQKRREKLCRLSEVEWSRDVTRHTYGSYLAALEGVDREVVRRSMGHTGFGVFARNYENTRKPEEAAEFWAIVPLA